MQCPCGTGLELDSCCGPYHEGSKKPEMPEQLMRSRYSAFVVHNVDYLIETNHASTRDELERGDLEKWSTGVDWLGLEVVKAEGDDTKGTVEFIARYREDGRETQHHELSSFVREDGAWFFLDGKMVPTVRKTKKVGPNEKCPCGSDKKYKKCCGRP